MPTSLGKHNLIIKRLKFRTHRILTVNLTEAESLNFAFNTSVRLKLLVLKLCQLFISLVKKMSLAVCITRKAIYFKCSKDSVSVRYSFNFIDCFHEKYSTENPYIRTTISCCQAGKGY